MEWNKKKEYRMWKSARGDTKIKAQSDQGQNKEKWFKKYWQCIVNPSWRIHLSTNEMGFCSFEGFISIRTQWTFKTGGFDSGVKTLFFFTI